MGDIVALGSKISHCNHGLSENREKWQCAVS